jgi:nucleotide-binding universal stress UspA family protein
MFAENGIGRSGSLNVHVGAREVQGRYGLKILCATRALSRSDGAVLRAHAIASAAGAQLLLLHVIDASEPVRTVRRRSALAHSILDANARELGLTSAEVSVRSGRAHETIASVAAEWDADLIVLGPHRPRFADSVLGTSAERIARKAGRSVLVVNSSSSSPYEHVLLTSDLSRMSAGIALIAKQLGFLQGVRVSVVHALEHTRSTQLYMAGVYENDTDKHQQSLRRLAVDEIDVHLFSAGLDSTRFAIFSPQAAPVRAIEQTAARTRCDLVVVGSSRFPEIKRLLVGSVSNEVLRKAKRDVLLVPPAAPRRARRRVSEFARAARMADRPQRDLRLH